MQPSMQMTSRNEERAPDPAEISRLREAATPDNPEACYVLGLALKAIGTPAGSAEAVLWFAAASMGHHPGGHYQMALHCRNVDSRQLASYHIEASAFQEFESALRLMREWKAAGYLDSAN
ncbi:MAG TPA: hypothetical protein VGZ73_09435 [Bryobacteraceae bacterium]|jgi:hypothetical protein|nr:hypothetical protein [Bryobacteraceae bacterium]